MVVIVENSCRYRTLISSVYEYWHQPGVIVGINYSKLMACILSKCIALNKRKSLTHQKLGLRSLYFKVSFYGDVFYIYGRISPICRIL